MKSLPVLAMLVSLPAQAFAQADATSVVRYEATIDTVKYVYGPAEAVARVKPGQIIEANALDAFGNALQKPGDTLAMVKGDNPLTGPFYIEGAEPGDTLVVKVLDVQVDSVQGVGGLGPGFGALNATTYTPMLQAPLPERIWFYAVDKATNTATFKALDSSFSVAIPLHPFLGCMGVAPAGGESRLSVTPGEWGGNMDSPEVSAGHTVYFPVNVPGALLYFGDGHAAQGDGEVAGTGIEIPMRVRLQVDVLKGKKIAWPRFENDRALMAVGAYRPLDDALRIAFTELIGWITADYGLSALDAYELLSKVARIHLNEMVDPNYVVVAIIDKQFLPPPRSIHSPTRR
jgi:amidase